MDNPCGLQNNNPREEPRPFTLEYYITRNLGYCCEWFFFQLYKDSALIAAHLGVTRATVKRHKKWAKDEVVKCKSCVNCLKEKLNAKI